MPLFGTPRLAPCLWHDLADASRRSTWSSPMRSTPLPPCGSSRAGSRQRRRTDAHLSPARPIYAMQPAESGCDYRREKKVVALSPPNGSSVAQETSVQLPPHPLDNEWHNEPGRGAPNWSRTPRKHDAGEQQDHEPGTDRTLFHCCVRTFERLLADTVGVPWASTGCRSVTCSRARLANPVDRGVLMTARRSG